MGKCFFNGSNFLAVTITGTFSENGEQFICSNVYYYGSNDISISFTLGNNVKVSGDFLYIYDDSISGYSAYPIAVNQLSYGPILSSIENIPVVKIADQAFYTMSSTMVKTSSIDIPVSITKIGLSAFYNCTSIETINFEGTIDQWNAITFGSNWNYNVPATYVQCSDGQVPLS